MATNPLKSFLDGLADAIRTVEGSTGKIPAPTYRERILGLSGSGGGGGPDATNVKFGPEQIDPDVQYSINYNWFAEVVRLLQTAVGKDEPMTPPEIVYYLGRVIFVPQGWATSELNLSMFEVDASGKLPVVKKGTAASALSMGAMFTTSAVGVVEE